MKWRSCPSHFPSYPVFPTILRPHVPSPTLKFPSPSQRYIDFRFRLCWTWVWFGLRGLSSVASIVFYSGRIAWRWRRRMRSPKSISRPFQREHQSTCSVSQSINQPIAQSVNQSINQPINQSISQSINQSIMTNHDQSWPIMINHDQSINHLQSTFINHFHSITINLF